jgi:hypothetical protein
MSKQNINMKHILAFLQDNYTTISVVFAADQSTGAISKLDEKV